MPTSMLMAGWETKVTEEKGIFLHGQFQDDKQMYKKFLKYSNNFMVKMKCCCWKVHFDALKEPAVKFWNCKMLRNKSQMKEAKQVQVYSTVVIMMAWQNDGVWLMIICWLGIRKVSKSSNREYFQNLIALRKVNWRNMLVARFLKIRQTSHWSWNKEYLCWVSKMTFRGQKANNQ